MSSNELKFFKFWQLQYFVDFYLIRLMMMLCFSCDGRHVLHGSSCLLVYDNASASIAAR